MNDVLQLKKSALARSYVLQCLKNHYCTLEVKKDVVLLDP